MISSRADIVDLNEIATQVSLDVTNVADALNMAHGAVRAGVDRLQAGTPLISEGSLLRDVSNIVP